MTDSVAFTRPMKTHAQAAVSFARSGYGVELDYSPRSVKKVETLFATFHAEAPRTKGGRLARTPASLAIAEALSLTFGGYIGEVLRREFGGQWRMQQSNFAEPAVSLAIGGGRMFPPNKAYKRLNEGAAADLWQYYRTLRKILREERAGRR